MMILTCIILGEETPRVVPLCSVCISSDLRPVHQSDQPVVHSEYSVPLPQSTPVGGAQAVHALDEQLEASY